MYKILTVAEKRNALPIKRCRKLCNNTIKVFDKLHNNKAVTSHTGVENMFTDYNIMYNIAPFCINIKKKVSCKKIRKYFQKYINPIIRIKN